ncbi:MAG: hypothetical protein Q8N26_00950 [Myxococcales bacterium]|nr:hypothetical protein [Myxococcales bacterium]
MSFFKRLFGAAHSKEPSLGDEAFSPFLRGWEYELRSSSRSPEALFEELPERFFEHFSRAFDQPTEARLITELSAWTERFLLELQVSEQSWVGPTGNDRLAAAFEALRSMQLIAIEDAGVSIQDGWAMVGLAQRRLHRGAVFFHQQDVLDAIRGEPLLLAFGAFEERPHAPSNDAIGADVFQVLAAHGLSPSWSGDARERISLEAFPWRKRRWTNSPEVEPVPCADFSASPLDAEKLRVPEALRPENAGAFAQRVTAVRSSAGFNVPLSERFETTWKQHGGVRGQLCHLGPPHTFVRAGDQTDLGVRSAFVNLEPVEASSLRRPARSYVISKERASAIRSTPWARPGWSTGGGPGRVGLFVLSSSPLSLLVHDDSPVDWPEWCPVLEIPETFTWRYRDRASDESQFTGLETAARLAREHTTVGPADDVIERLHRTQFGAFIQGLVPDPPDLGYLQVGWAIARWLLQHGDGILMDAESGRWWTSEELLSWEAGGWPTGRRFLLERELRFSTAIEGPSCIVATQGLTKFGRPELVCLAAAQQVNTSGDFTTALIPGWLNEATERFATRLALGEQVKPGDVLTLGSMSFQVERATPGVNTPEGSPEGALLITRSVGSSS